MRPLTPGAAKITVEAANEPVVNVEAAVERLLPCLKNDISSSESSNPGTLSPDIELGEIFEFGETAQRVQIDPEPEQLNLRPEVEDESDAEEHPPTLNLEIEDDKGQWSIAYQNYLNTRQRIALINGKFRAYNNLDLHLPRDVFGPHPGHSTSQT